MNHKKGLCRYSSDLDSQIQDFLRVAYPERNPELLLPRWKWMFLESSARCDVQPLVWMYHDGDRISAHQGAIAVRYWDGIKETTTGWFVETMALPDIQGTPIGPSVIMKAKQDLPFNLSLGQTAEMRELQFRLGWRQICPLNVFLKPLNWSALMRGKTPTVLRPCLGALLTIRDRIRGRFQKPEGITANELEDYTSEHDAFWDSIKKHLRSCVVRDASYLNWKYVQQPGQNFIRLEFREKGQIVGLAVLKILSPTKAYKYRRMQIVDFLATPEKPELVIELLRSLTQKAVELAADAIIFMNIASWLNQPLETVGFMKRDPTRYLLVSSGNADAETKDSLLESDHWFVTQGDSDIDRPE